MIIQRGNNRQDIFRAEDDYHFYLEKLNAAAQKHQFDVRAYAFTRLSPDAQQGSILGSWLAITQVGFTPTKVRGIAKPLLTP